MTLKQCIDRLRLWLVFAFWPWRRCGAHFCANRKRWTYRTPNLEISLNVRALKEPDGWSREELLEMLRLIRREEKKQDWKVPEEAEAN